jgi:hypothetical protein
MVYTHYWAYQPDSPSFATVFPHLVADTRLIIARLSDHGIELAGPSGIGQPLLHEAIITFNGARPDTGENFVLAPGAGSGLTERTRTGEPFRLDYCQTRRQPYDLAVTTVLLRAQQLAPQDMVLASDGSWTHDWDRAQTLLGALFGAPVQVDALMPLSYLRGGPHALQAQALAAA